MRRPLLGSLLLAFAAWIASTGELPTAQAQPAPVEENFTTGDGVRLKGLFHQSPKPLPGDPVVVLLYPPGGKNTLDGPGDWTGLANLLTAKGFHVFRFDWRGHGRSTDIVDTELFWNLKQGNPHTGSWNTAYVRGLKDKPLKNKLTTADFNAKYFPVYVNDLTAARAHLDQKNDNSVLNTSSIYLIGAGDAATIGFFWTVQEWDRPAIAPQFNGGRVYSFTPMPKVVVNPPAGPDIAGAIWLSASRPATTTLKDKTVESLATLVPRVRTQNPMLFLTGSKEPAKQGADSKFFFEQVLQAKPKKGVESIHDQTRLVELKNANLTGTSLLGKNAETGVEDTILQYLEARQKDRATVVRKERKYVAPYFVDLKHYGILP